MITKSNIHRIRIRIRVRVTKKKSNIQPQNIIKMGKFLIVAHVKKSYGVLSLTKAYSVTWLLKYKCKLLLKLLPPLN